MGATGKRQMTMRGNGSGAVAPTSPNVLLIAANGESNATGYGLNSEAILSEIGIHASLKIWNSATSVFEPVNISANTEPEILNTHGWELRLSQVLESGSIGPFNEVYFVKTAKGGTKIIDWAIGGTWEQRMRDRMSGALSALSAAGKTPKIVFWYSQGINDQGTTPTQSWIDGTIAHFANLRSLYGSNLPIVMTKFNGSNTRFNPNIQDIADAQFYTDCVDATGAALNADGIHWSYAGQKTIVDRLITATIPFL